MFICEMKAMDRLVSMLRAAGDPTRLRLLLLLRQAELTVSELIEIVGQSPAARLPPSEAAGRGRAAGALQGRQLGVLPRRRPGHGRRTGRAPSPPWPIPASQEADKARLAHVREARANAAAAYFKANAAEWERIRALHAPEKDVEAAIVRRLTARPIENLLDAGTGTGRMLELLAPHAARAVGIDVSPDMLAIARDRLLRGEHPAMPRCGWAIPIACRFPMARAGSGFDVVLFHQVLHYLDDPRRGGGRSGARHGAGRAAADRRFRAA